MTHPHFIKTYYLLFSLIFVSFSLYAQNPATVGFSVCVQPVPIRSQGSFTLIWQRSRQSYPLRDTCIRFTTTATHTIKTLIVEAEGYTTQAIQFRPDTLRAGHTYYVILPEKVNQLSEVVVHSKKPSYYRGDTLVINAGAVETEPNGSAGELLDNLSEATSFGGTLRIDGKEIGRVYIDGKEAAGSGLTAILNGLRADMIRTIEVYQGVIDGRTLYIMDIKLNADRRRGFYGNTLAGAGSRAAGYARINRVEGSNLLSIQGNHSTANDLYRLLAQLRSEPPKLALPFASAYSLAEFVENQNRQSITFKPRSVNQYDLLVGDNRQSGGSVALSQQISRQLTLNVNAGYEQLTLNQASQTVTQTVLGTTTQRVQTSETDSTRPRQLTASWQLVWRPGPADVIKLAGDLTHQTALTNESSRQISQLSTDGQALSGSTARHRLNQQLRATVGEQRLMWTHRFRRPAQVFSLYAALFTDQSNRQQTYQNRFQTDDMQRVTDQQTMRGVGGRGFDWQIRFARPVSRRWLIEVTGQQTREQYSVDQNGYAYQPATFRYGLFVPALSVAGFAAADEQRTLRTLLVHRTPRVRLVGGASLVSVVNERQLRMVPTRYERTEWNPYLFVGYRLSDQTLFTASLKRYQQSPYWQRLLPVTDSTSVISTVRGNPQLVYNNTQQLEGGVKFISARRRELTLQLGYELTSDPVLPVIRYDSATSFANLTYRQAASEDRLRLALLGIMPQLTESLSLFANASVSFTNTYGFLGEQLNRYQTTNYELSFSSKWIPAQHVTIQASNQVYVAVQRSGPQQTSASYRDLLSLSVKAKILAHTYFELQSFITFNRFSGSALSGQIPQVIANTYILLTKKRNLKVNLLINNPFGSSVTSTAYSSLNTLYQTQTQQLPPLWLLGLNYYLAVWPARR